MSELRIATALKPETVCLDCMSGRHDEAHTNYSACQCPCRGEREETLISVRLDYLVRDSMALLDDLNKARKGAAELGEIDELASMQQFISARLIQLRKQL